MKNFLRIAMTVTTVVGLAGLASAGDDKAGAAKAPTPTAAKADPKAPPAPPAKPDAAKPVAAPTPVKADAAKPAPTPTPVKADPKVPVVAEKAAKPAELPVPVAPTELADAGKALAGTWKCKGQGFAPDGTAAPMAATMKLKLDTTLDKFWIRGNFAETGKKKGAYKFENFTTFDPASKKWTRVMVDNMGGVETMTSDGPKDGKTTWEGTSRSSMGTGKARHYEETAGKEVKMWGEWSVDGKTWTKGYEAVCKK
ncbi:MAG TPA: hypothetical protein VM734_13495 [Kofleriaceae bacterium]|jgi:hypothetical protein|nr:hypothetical protein [Kofleriaceae bacterium]